MSHNATFNSLLPLFPASALSAVKDFGILKGVLLGTYTQRGRYYHNLNHIRDLLIQAEKYRDAIERPVEFTVAILFHDAVYEVFRKDNEVRSAALAHSLGSQIFDDVSWDVVHTLIMGTTHKGDLGRLSKDCQLLADMDLWTFGQNYDVFRSHSYFVDAEYLTVFSPEQYKEGRKAFLQGMLNRPFIYYLNVYSEEAARENIQRALEALNS